MTKDNRDTNDISNFVLKNELKGILKKARKRCPRTGRFIKTESSKPIKVNKEGKLNAKD